MVWDADEGSSLSRSLHLRVVGWIPRLAPFFPSLPLYYLLFNFLSYAYIRHNLSQGRHKLFVGGRILDQGRYTRISKGLGIVNQDCVRSINDNTQRSRCLDVGSV